MQWAFFQSCPLLILFKSIRLVVYFFGCLAAIYFYVKYACNGGSVAVAFGFLSVILLFKKRYFSSSLCFAVAVSFHVTSVFLLVVFAACLPARVILIATLAALFVKLSFMLKVIAPIFSLVGLSNVSWMITNYSSSLDYGYSMSFYDPRLVLAILMSYIIYRYQLKQNNQFFVSLSKVFMLGVLFFVGFSDITILAYRISFLMISSVIVLPLASDYFDSTLYRSYNLKKIYSLSFLSLFFLYSVSLAFSFNPYSNYLLI